MSVWRRWREMENPNQEQWVREDGAWVVGQTWGCYGFDQHGQPCAGKRRTTDAAMRLVDRTKPLNVDTSVPRCLVEQHIRAVRRGHRLAKTPTHGLSHTPAFAGAATLAVEGRRWNRGYPGADEQDLATRNDAQPERTEQ